MTTGRQVDRLLWAVAEARRLRDQEEHRRGEPSLSRGVTLLAEGFVTEWQPADLVAPVSLR